MITGKKIENMLEEAWNNFLDYYKEKAPKYRESWPLELNENDAKDSHWICWDEYDLMFHIGRFFYDILSKKKEEEFSNIEIHFEKKVNSTSFNDYEFEDRLEKLNERLISNGVIKKGKSKKEEGPKVDMIVAYEDKPSPFLLCAEVKYFHSYVRYGPNKNIDADIEKLKAIRDYRIAQRVVFILFDDNYHYRRGRRTSIAIQKKLDKIRDENGITVLYHTSEAKLDKYKH